MQIKTDDAGKEKHVPVIEKTAKGIIVRIGSVPHPMEEKHYIQWIEVISGDSLFVKALKPGQKPEAEFPVTGARAKYGHTATCMGSGKTSPDQTAESLTTLSPRTGQGNSVYYTLLRATILTFKRLSLILHDAAWCDLVVTNNRLLLEERGSLISSDNSLFRDLNSLLC